MVESVKGIDLTCMCEQIKCPHGESMCGNRANQTLSTIYGPYTMCADCANAMPREYTEVYGNKNWRKVKGYAP